VRHSPITEFALLARLPDDALDLERLVLSVARLGTPTLDTEAVRRDLDRLADRVADDVSPSAPPDRLAAALARTIGGTLGFRGDPEAFGTPEASYLDHVLARRTGLPILLAIVWMRIGARVGVPISGIGYPGHFLARLELPGAPLYVDPFSGGAPVEASDLLARLPPSAPRALLDPSPTRAIVTRVLTNLKHLHIDRGDNDAGLAVVDRLLLLGGEVPAELRDRGLLLLRLARNAEGARDLERYISLAPEAADRSAVEAVLARARRG
jgi:regulator of sirC expression with transglutaminase-like and TPR domain